MIYIVINGTGGVGKDLFSRLCGEVLKEKHYEYFNISTVDWVKKIARQIGWDGKKDERGRKLLSDLKIALTKYNDLPLKKTLSEIAHFELNFMSFYHFRPKGITFIHCREKDDIERIVETLRAKKLLVVREEIKPIESNHSDKQVFDTTYDYLIDNCGTVEDLKKVARALVEDLEEGGAL